MSYQTSDPISVLDEQKERLFVTAYLTHLNASKAARVCGYGYLEAPRAGHKMLKKPSIRQAIDDALAARLERLQQKLEQVEADEPFVLQKWFDIIRADVNEVVQHRRTCCRYCHGTDGGYQRTRQERQRDYNAWKMSPEALVDEFDELGGVGYDPTLAPHPDCSECFGEGVSNVHIADTRDLSPAAAALFAGVKQTKDGVEVKLHSKEKALELMARHFGMLKDKMEHSGKVTLEELVAGTGGPAE
jgi:phage terminase small subunit